MLKPITNDQVRLWLIAPFAIGILGGWLGTLVYAVVAHDTTLAVITTPIVGIPAGWVFGTFKAIKKETE